MFKRRHHLRIATVLHALDAERLFKYGCYFGGGTAIVLSHDEYRESVDIDFLISNRDGFRELRQGLTGKTGISSITRQGSSLALARTIRADQYGIRTMLSVGDVQIKFEIILEGRISFDDPGPSDRVCGVTTLTQLDMATSKILANSDRWSDGAVYSRDLIDLAMLRLPARKFKLAMGKAKLAYGQSAQRDLLKAIEKMKQQPGRLSECMRALKMESAPEAVVWSRIRTLQRTLNAYSPAAKPKG